MERRIAHAPTAHCPGAAGSDGRFETDLNRLLQVQRSAKLGVTCNTAIQLHKHVITNWCVLWIVVSQWIAVNPLNYDI